MSRGAAAGQAIDDWIRKKTGTGIGDRFDIAANDIADVAFFGPLNALLDRLGFPDAMSIAGPRDFWGEYFHKMARMAPLVKPVRVP